MERVKRDEPLGIGQSFLDLGSKIFHEARSPGCWRDPEGKKTGQDMPNQALPGGHGLGKNILRRILRPDGMAGGMGQKPDHPDPVR